MATKLWTLHFMRICLANLLLFVSLYMLYPIIPSLMAERLGIPVYQSGAAFLLLTLGMFCAGPFHGYLVDAYKRKYVCMYSFFVMIAAAFGYVFVRDVTQLLMLCIVQGIAFGIATTSGITLAIDVTNTSFRSAGNVVFSWASRLGMVTGVALGAFLFQEYGFKTMIYASVLAGLGGAYFVSRVYVPFRAPIGTKLFSNDRFLLFRAWIPALNLILIALVPGILIPELFQSIDRVWVSEIVVPFFALSVAGFLLSAFLIKFMFHGDHKKMWLQIVLGLLMIIGAMALLIVAQKVEIIVAAVLLGLGLGLITPEFLMMFVKLSQHCQRGTANSSNLLAWEIGITSGIAIACYLGVTGSEKEVCETGMLAAVAALAFFVLITFPYYKKKRVR